MRVTLGAGDAGRLVRRSASLDAAAVRNRRRRARPPGDERSAARGRDPSAAPDVRRRRRRVAAARARRRRDGARARRGRRRACARALHVLRRAALLRSRPGRRPARSPRHGRQLWNSHLGHGPGSDIAIPLLVSNRGYALFFDNPSDAVLAVGRSDNGVRIDYTAETAALDLVLPDRRRPARPHGRGRRAARPRAAAAALGARLLAVDPTLRRHRGAAARCRARSARSGFPCDALIYLSTYGEAMGWNRGVGHLEWQPTLWPKPAALLDEVRRQHFEFITHEYPVLHEQSPLFAEAEARGYLLTTGYERGAGGVGQLSRRPAPSRLLEPRRARVVVGGAPRARASSASAAGGSTAAKVRRPPRSSPPATARSCTTSTIASATRAFAEGEAAARPEQRVFLLCRSGRRRHAAVRRLDVVGRHQQRLSDPGGPGSARAEHGSVGRALLGHRRRRLLSSRAGDRRALRALVPVRRVQPDLPLARLGVARAHAVGSRSRGRGDLPRYAELRYRLLPYTYTLAWQAHALGLPLMRPLVLNYPDDPKTWTLDHEYLWGDDLLVAPVTREGATAWPVYLPQGEWFDFWTGERHLGPGGVTLAAPLERLPLLVRAGAILPLGPIVQHTGERPLDELTLQIYPHGHVTLRALRGRRPHERLSPRRLRPDADRVRGAAGSRVDPHRAGGRRSIGRARRPALSAPRPGRATARRHGGGERRAPARRRRHRAPGMVDGRRGIPLRPAVRRGGARDHGDVGDVARWGCHSR